PPPARVTRLLDDGVVHYRAAAGLGDPAQEFVFQLGGRSAAALDHHRVDVTRRPQAREIRLRSLSFNSGFVPPPHWITPVPTSRSTSVSAKSSDSGAQGAR